MSEIVNPKYRFFRGSLIVFGLFLLSMSFWLIWIQNNRIVPILMYHHIRPQESYGANVLSPKMFEKHMAYLKEYDFRVVSMDELIDSMEAGQSLGRKTAVLTFDDGYEDNYTQAFPILKKYGYTATMYISSDKIGQDGYMSWEQITALKDAGMIIASHAHTHRYLPDLPEAEQWDEIYNSKNMLERRLGVVIDHFAYPIGGFNHQIKEFIKLAGYRSASATNRGYDRYNKDVFELNRVSLDQEDDFGAIRWAKFSGYYNLFRRPKNPD